MEETMWDPAQLHFHAPSEHTLNGRNFIAEMHIVHTPVNGFVDQIYIDTANQYPNEYAVLGVWFEEGDCDGLGGADATDECNAKLAATEAFFDAMGVFESESKNFGTTLNVSNVPIQAFIDSLSLGKFYSYDGSLTTPPCTEGVNWTMVAEPVKISAEVSASIQSRYNNNPDFAPCEEGVCSGGNNRVTMPVNRRTVWLNDMAVSATVSAITLGALSAFIM